MRLLVLVLGAGGQLGEAMTLGLAPRHEVVTRGHAELDITIAADVRETIAAICPDVIVNCAAATNVDGAESDPVGALDANTWAVRSLARAASEIDATFVHFSTDFVFDGVTTTPYVESDRPNPRGAYAVSKLLGEWFAAQTPRHFVLRVESLFGGHTRKSSVDWMLDSILHGREVRAFADRTVSPSYVEDVVATTRALVERSQAYGLYHCVNTGWTTWLGLAQEIAMMAGRPDAPIVAAEMAAAGLKARRPQFAALASERLEAVGIEMPTWQNALDRYVQSVMNSAEPPIARRR